MWELKLHKQSDLVVTWNGFSMWTRQNPWWSWIGTKPVMSWSDLYTVCLMTPLSPGLVCPFLSSASHPEEAFLLVLLEFCAYTGKPHLPQSYRSRLKMSSLRNSPLLSCSLKFHFGRANFILMTVIIGNTNWILKSSCVSASAKGVPNNTVVIK